MRKSKFQISKLLILPTLFLGACEDQATYTIKETGYLRENANAEQQLEIPTPTPTPVVNNTGAAFTITAKEYSETERKANDAQIIFVIDNSASMLDDIASCNKVYLACFEQLKSAVQPFRVRFLGMDKLLAQLNEVNGDFTR